MGGCGDAVFDSMDDDHHDDDDDVMHNNNGGPTSGGNNNTTLLADTTNLLDSSRLVSAGEYCYFRPNVLSLMEGPRHWMRHQSARSRLACKCYSTSRRSGLYLISVKLET